MLLIFSDNICENQLNLKPETRSLFLLYLFFYYITWKFKCLQAIKHKKERRCIGMR
jgi:hypothetical protein